ncbi:MAG TPA: hypothetical protein IGS37_06390 [Synechococcales cyanobacterium M55_K2018_004]|nr:hypothetical protein [Synechococcales cyanobacterium M55_K2018_004]
MSSRFYRCSKVTLLGSLLGAAVGLVGMSQVAIAQFSSSPTGAASDLQSPREGTTDPFSSQGGGNMNTMLDLIHRANFGQIRSPEQFRQDQRNQINSEAENFRNAQQRLLQQQQQSPSATPVTTPAPRQP